MDAASRLLNEELEGPVTSLDDTDFGIERVDDLITSLGF